ncbi:hypothetical protein GGX14DRAFT_663380 [Mycena pura]|uniref:Uncharacterized protein n=1 Tax=Mycena pura TaxID=153505 RepID=A0AAD7E1C8_9AGAR|nr:hypothetical protein GGX14DRAFT_663380 [Mycena pura]
MNNPKPGLVTPIAACDVEQSRAKRLQRQQSRFRDRGGIFVPSTSNDLVDILLGKKKLSPLKRRSRSRSLSASPTKPPSAARKNGGKAVKAQARTKALKPQKLAADTYGHDDTSQKPVAGPSRLPNTVNEPLIKATAHRKGKNPVPDVPPAGDTAPKRKGRAPKSKQTIKDSAATPSKSTTKRKVTKVTALDDPPDDVATKKQAAARKSRASRTAITAEDSVGADVAPAVAAKSAASSRSKLRGKATARKSKPDVPQCDEEPQPGAKRARGKARPNCAELLDGGEHEKEEVQGKKAASDAKRTREAKARDVELSDSEEDEQEEPQRKKTTSRAKGARVVKARGVELADGEENDGEVTKGKKAVRSKDANSSRARKTEGKGKQAKPAKRTARKRQPPEDGGVSDQARPTKRLKTAPQAKDDDHLPARRQLEVIPEEDEDAMEEEAPAMKTPTLLSKHSDSTSKPTETTPSTKKRARERDVTETEVQTRRKRVKVAVDAEETPVAKPKKRASAKSKSASTTTAGNNKRANTRSRVLKESVMEKPPAPIVRRRAPPQSVLDRVREPVLADDGEPDELDLLS